VVVNEIHNSQSEIRNPKSAIRNRKSAITSVNFIEVRLKTALDCGDVLDSLNDPDVLGAWENGGTLHLYWPEDRWDSGMLQRLRTALGALGSAPEAKDIIVTVVPDRDWNLIWTRSIEPIRVGRRILIRQSWNAARPAPGDIELVIDPKRAFGTGFHATTQLLLAWLEDKICGGEKVLDVGTGSGILSMAALRLGARSALGVDHDPVAIECALEHAADNGFGAELELRIGEIADLAEREYDLIVANLDRNTLLRCSYQLLRPLRIGGSLLVSGILAEDCPDISASFSSADGVLRHARRKEEWAAIEISRRAKAAEGP